MKLLAIETSSVACSVALLIGDLSVQSYQIAPRQHNQLLLSMIDQLLKENAIKIHQLDALAYSQGPGSFTGIRLSASMIQGLALANDLPVIPISTLQIQAQSANRYFQESKIIVCNDARMQAVYWGCYQKNALNIMEAVTEERCTTMSEVLLASDTEWLAVGDGWDAYQDEIPTNLTKIKYAKELIYPQAIDMLTIAELNFKKKLFVTAEEALPVYLREMQYK